MIPPDSIAQRSEIAISTPTTLPRVGEQLRFGQFCEMIGYKPPNGVSKSPKKDDATPALKLAQEKGFTGWRFNSNTKKFYQVEE